MEDYTAHDSLGRPAGSGFSQESVRSPRVSRSHESSERWPVSGKGERWEEGGQRRGKKSAREFDRNLKAALG